MQGETRMAAGARNAHRWLGGALTALAFTLAGMTGSAWSATGMPPTVSLSASSTAIAVSAVATLTAVASDPDGTIKQVDFYNGSSRLYTAKTPPYTYDFKSSKAGTFAMTALATDSSGLKTRSEVVNITVGTVTNPPPTVALSSSSTSLIVGGAAATLTATATDSNGTITKVEFYNGSTRIATDTSAPYNATFAPTAAGTFQITARAYDDQNAQATSTAVTITVAPAGTNPPPSVSLSSNLTTLAVGGTSATLTATATDSNGTIAKVEFYNGTTLLATDTTSPYNATFTPTTTGTFSLTAKAYDNGGASATSAPVSVSVISNRAPTVSLATSIATLPINGIATLTATAADTDGTIANVEFYNGTTLIRTATVAP